jgi:transmembrane sensor
MNRSSPHIDARADEQAALWAARLDGSVLSAADRIALDTWLAANPSHRVLLSSYCQFSADLENCLPALVEAGVVKMPPADAPAQSSRRTFMWSSLMAAAAVLALSVWFVQPTTESKSLVTAAGHRQTVTLADGSRIEMNAHTTLQVELGRHERRVRLTGGEAFFSVTKDASRPFIVETPSGSVRVTGTAFDVRTDSTAKFVVTVVQGSVQVRPAQPVKTSDTPFMLGAGDRLTFDAKGVSVEALPAAALSDALAWRNGQVVFVDASLANALAQFAQYHGRSFSASPPVAELKIGGRFSLDDADGFLTALQQILPVAVTHESTGAVLVDARPPH